MINRKKSAEILRGVETVICPISDLLEHQQTYSVHLVALREALSDNGLKSDFESLMADRQQIKGDMVAAGEKLLQDAR